MKALLFYTKSDNAFLKKLIHNITETIDSKELLLCHSFEELVAFLQTIHHDFDIICLVANNKFELESLISLRHFLKDRKIIFVLPNGVEKSIFKEIFQISPKYIGYLDETYHYTTAVLAKMIQAKNTIAPSETLKRR